jgi:hypothetical protein
MNGDARVTGGRSLPGRVESSPAIKASFASDLDLAERRIAAKRVIPHRLTQIIKNCRCVSGAARDYGWSARPLSAAAIEETHADRVF